MFALLYEKFISEAICQICSKSVEFYESYGETHFDVFFMPHSVVTTMLLNQQSTVVSAVSFGPNH